MNYLRDFDEAHERSPVAANALLFGWLESDQDRTALLAQMRAERSVLEFQSRQDTSGNADQKAFSQRAFLLSRRADIEHALEHFSSDPYKPVGSGSFVLASNNNEEDRHPEKRNFLAELLRFSDGGASAFIEEVHRMAWTAVRLAWVAPGKSEQFDLVTDVAEQAALRFVAGWVGIPDHRHVLLQETIRLGYRATLYQMVARHFVSEPSLLGTGTGALTTLARVVGQLIVEASSGTRPQSQLMPQSIAGCRRDTLIERMVAGTAGELTSELVRELAVNVVGTISGLMSNVPAAVSMTINELFKDPVLLERATKAARTGSGELNSLERANAGAKELERFVIEAMRLNPPAAFLPRSTTAEVELSGIKIPAEANVILPLAGATRDRGDDPDRFDEDRVNSDSLIFGHPSRDSTSHRCLGEFISVPLIAHIVRHVLLLPGLAPRIDPETGQPFGLRKQWGYICRSLPMEYARGRAIRQRPLNVIMRVKAPIAKHAETLRKIVRYGAPTIEHLLSGGANPRTQPQKIVHFARFVLLNNDSELGLFTTYDGDFEGYIRYFAVAAGPVFDQIFDHIDADAPTPVSEHPDEFVDFVRRHDVASVANYFFSGYPDRTVTHIVEAPDERD